VSSLHDLFSVVVGPYTIEGHPRTQPFLWEGYVGRNVLAERIVGVAVRDPLICYLIVSELHRVLLALKLTYEPAGGVYPSALLIPETRTLFIGAGESLIAYRLEPVIRLWHDTNDSGFHGWARYNNVIMMSAELEVAAWNIRGEKLWSMYVEPPYGYTVEKGIVYMDRMDEKLEFPLEAGPDKWRNTPCTKET
jgi:hypothetical protein